MEYLWVISTIVCAWAMLRVIGGERQHRLQQLKAIHAAQEAALLAPPEPAKR